MLKYEYLEKSYQHYHTAEHLLTVTFPLAKDPKLLLGVLDNLAKAGEYLINAVLSSKLDKYPEDFLSKLILYRKYGTKADFLGKLHDLNVLHRTCPVEFRRGNTLVMCTNGYEMHTLSLPEIKQYLVIVKETIESNKKP